MWNCVDKCGTVWISMELCGLVWNCAEKFRLCQNDINAPFCWRFEAVLTYYLYLYLFVPLLYHVIPKCVVFCIFVVSPSVNKQSSWQPVLSSGLRHHTHDTIIHVVFMTMCANLGKEHIFIYRWNIIIIYCIIIFLTFSSMDFLIMSLT